ncbi:MAG: hypothetical protein M3494_18595 [Actinomycetota bacterium]|jgi:hypothetical protein|nr:hypothetical protein [Rubrobacter sp.]MDQ3509984.1 hypothetical protein [Actinomycetota bacterium]
MVVRLSASRIVPEDTQTVLRAVERVGDGFSFWDGRVIEGMRIENPFV